MQTVHRRRRAVLIGGLAVLLLAVVLIVRACSGGDDGGQNAASGSGEDAPLPQLPGGGRTILPEHRVVAYYGAPQDDALGALGIGSPASAGRKLAKVAEEYETPERPVMPAMELIAVIANAHEGTDGMFRTRQTDKVIRRYLRAARKMDAILILDVQPGRSDFLQEAMALEKWLRKPDVSLALDPEWRVNAPDVPGQVIGSVDAREVNAVSFWLEGIIREERLPQKLLLIHRFTGDMIANQSALKDRRGIALAINIDGFGGQAIKKAKYRELTAPNDRYYDGFKLFYEEDSGLLSPRQVLRMRPPPDVVVYE